MYLSLSKTFYDVIKYLQGWPLSAFLILSLKRLVAEAPAFRSLPSSLLVPPTLSAASRTRSTLPHPKLPLNYGPPQLRMMYQWHCWAGLACYEPCSSCHLRNSQARQVFCAFPLFGEDQKAACHGRFLRGSRTFPQSQVCFDNAGADEQLEEHQVKLDAFSYAYAG
jgi:hypothetical protein